jgi:hypothetical protein
MNLSERLQTAPRQVEKNLCKFGAWVSTLSDDDQQAVKAAVNDRSWSVQALTTVLEESGCPVGRNSINHHRHGMCRSCNGVGGQVTT